MDSRIVQLAHEYLAKSPNSRAAKAIRLMLERGSATTNDLNRLGYNHPPRTIGDVKDLGFPVIKEMVRGPDGRRMASYRFGSFEDIRQGQIGRTNFSKAFKTQLIAKYGQRDAITMAEHPARLLQIDHRIPYRVGGDAGLEANDVDAYMLLDAKSQRAKSWSCEQCRNFLDIWDPEICRRCFWAYPANYEHIAMQNERRVDIVWCGDEVIEYDLLAKQADREGIPVAELLKQLGRNKIAGGSAG